MNRYKPSHKVEAITPLLDLLQPEDITAAEALGRAMRLGAMLSGGSKRLLSKTRLDVEDGEVTLTLQRSARQHSGEVVAKRLAGLADVLGLKHRIVQL